MGQERMLQVISANGGCAAVYANERADGPRVLTVPVVCWALVESGPEPGAQRVVGLTSDQSGLNSCEARPNFLGYQAPGEGLERFLQYARQRGEKRGALPPI